LANYACEASSFFDAKGPPPSVGQLLIAIDPPSVGGEATLAHFAELASAVERDGEARLPGRRRQGLRRQAQTEGLAVDAEVIAMIQVVGR
jgi:(2R)-3-sulfolactate dehydrogenase (NADP+)